MQYKKPEIIVFAGANGSGKTTIKKMTQTIIEPYINADDIKQTTSCSDLEAARIAEEMREKCVSDDRSYISKQG
jgi:predicted ABC-type ATPase